ncbi:MAG: hypothetical protein M1829_006380 [Trizodia sp. TS-e1964]|nr:MAG: hypothetical protein M1829_006380 [Trizodia sp. TS-e1964]
MLFQLICRDGWEPSVDLLDNRAATHEKLGNLVLALRDGKKMIDREGSNPKGYLRAGKILVRMEKSDLATKMYSLGLSNVPKEDPHYDLLKRVYVKTSKSFDPMTILPLELVEDILSLVGFKAIVQSLRVSHQWNKIITSLPSLWRDLDLTDFQLKKRLISKLSIQSCIKRSQGTTRSVKLHHANFNWSNGLAYIAANCRNLSYLEIGCEKAGSSLIKAAPYAKNLQTLILHIDCEITLTAVMEILDACLSLSVAEFYNVRHKGEISESPHPWQALKTLVLNHVCLRWEEPQKLSTLLWASKLPSLRYLSLQGWTMPDDKKDLGFGDSKLERLSLRGVTMNYFPGLPPSLAHLDLGLTHRCVYLKDPMDPAPTFESLVLDSHFHLDYEKLVILLNDSPTKGVLKKLSLSHCFKMDKQGLMHLLENGYLDTLVYLNIVACGVDDEVAEAMPGRMEFLEDLNLSNSRISGVGVKALAVGMAPRLKKLNLSECNQVLPDAVDLARKFIPTVISRF